jgi:hypothetical protein
MSCRENKSLLLRAGRAPSFFRKEERFFFSEEKKQKTFNFWRWGN